MAKYCPMCGTEVKKRYEFCGNCGYVFTGKATLKDEEFFEKKIQEEFDEKEEVSKVEELGKELDTVIEKQEIITGNINKWVIVIIILLIIGSLLSALISIVILDIF